MGDGSSGEVEGEAVEKWRSRAGKAIDSSKEFQPRLWCHQF